LRWLLVALLAILLVLQYRLWIAEGSLAEVNRLEQQFEEQTLINRQLQQRNALLELEVLELQTGNQGLEQRAREQLGLIREGETFYQFVDGQSARPEALPAAADVTVTAAGGATAEPSAAVVAPPAEQQP
jgi:cell division protein FtsB